MQKTALSGYGGALPENNSGTVWERSETLFVILVALFSFVMRYLHISSTGWVVDDVTRHLGMRHEAGSVFHLSDADFFVFLARNFLEGKGTNIPFVPPFTAWTLVFFIRIFGFDYFSIKIMYAMLGALSVPAVYLTARILYGRGVAVVTSILCSTSFALIFISGGLNIENVYFFTLSIAVALYVILMKEPAFVRINQLVISFLFGVASASACLTRSEYILVLFIFFLFGLLRRGWSPAKKGVVALTAIAGFLLIVAPWVGRNYSFMTELNASYKNASLPVFVPTALNGPLNFLEGHHANADGTYSPVVEYNGYSLELKDGYIASLDPTDERHLAMIRDGYRLGLKYIAENPAKELKLIPFKTAVFLNGLSNGFFLNNFPAGLTGRVPNMADSFIPDAKWSLYVTLPLFLFGGWLLFRQKGEGETIFLRWLPIFIIGIVFFVAISFYALCRMSYPILPYYFMVVSLGVAGLGEKLRNTITFSWKYAFVLLFAVSSIGLYGASGRIVVEKSGKLPLGGYFLKDGRQ